jgi:hypothetical protein
MNTHGLAFPKPDFRLIWRDRLVISRHLKNIYTEGELEHNRTAAKNATVQKEGEREVIREIEFL